MKIPSSPILALMTVATAMGLMFAQNTDAQSQIVDYRAGVAGFAAGQDGINIVFSSPMPNTEYAVTVQATNTSGYSPMYVCTYFNPLHKRTDGFEVQHKGCFNGAPIRLDQNVSLNWIAIAYR